MFNKKRKGFTLIELIVVMAIIAILVALAAPRFLNYTKDAHVTAMQQDAKVLSNIALTYNVKNDGRWPAKVESDAFVPVDLATENNKVTIDDINTTYGATIEQKNVVQFDEALVKQNLKGLKNKIEDYGLIIAGDQEGEVVYLRKVLENSDGNKFITVERLVKPVETPPVVTP